jgi:membrane-associated protease RseP (regulator of RpoE activity)
MDTYVAVLIIVVIYLLILGLGRYLDIWNKSKVSFSGPVMMWKTRRGRKPFDRLGRWERLWSIYGSLSVLICLVTMGVIMAFLIWEAVLLFQGRDGSTGESLGKGFPGINQETMVVYLLFGMIIAVLVHELSHGILAVSKKIRLDSLGVLVFVIPIGAFIEPNDADLKAATRRTRRGLYSSGPASNILVAMVFMIILVGFLAPSVEPTYDGAVVVEVANDSPAASFGMSVWSQITEYNGRPITNADGLMRIGFGEVGGHASLTAMYRNERFVFDMPGGIAATEVPSGPAYNAGIRPGMIIASIDDKPVLSAPGFVSIVENASKDAPVNVTVMKYGFSAERGKNWFVVDDSIHTVNLTSKWLYYYLNNPKENREEYRDVSFMAVTVAPFGVTVEDPDFLTDPVARPFKDVHSLPDFAGATLRFLGLPFLKYTPVVSPAADLYTPTGLLSGLPVDVYWVIVNAVYWVFWANLVLGLANAVPALPLDGAFVLRDSIKGVAYYYDESLNKLDKAIGRRAPTERQVDNISKGITVLTYILIGYLMISQFL